MFAYSTRWLYCSLVALTFSQNGFAQPQKEFPKLDEKKIVELLKGEPEETVKLALYYLKIAEDTTDPKRYLRLFEIVEPVRHSPFGFGRDFSPKLVYLINAMIIHGGDDAVAVIPSVVKVISGSSSMDAPAFGTNPKRPKDFSSAYEILYSTEKKSLPSILAQLETKDGHDGLMICGTCIALNEYLRIPVEEPRHLGSGPGINIAKEVNWKWDEKYQALLKQAKTDEDKYHAALLCGEPLETAQKDLQKLIESPTVAIELRLKALRLYTSRAKTEVAEKYLASLISDKQDAKINLACKGILARLKVGEEWRKERDKKR